MLVDKKILVTGAGGFIGGHLARKLAEDGHFVRGVDVRWEGPLRRSDSSERVTLDLRTYENCLKVIEGVDEVYHLAADMGGIEYITRVGADIMHNSGVMDMNMLQASVENAVSRFFFSSSACVYPEDKQLDPEVKALKEEDAIPAQPDTYYGWEKLFTERMCAAYHSDHGLRTRIARYHNIYGPNGTYDGGKEKAPAALCRKIAGATDPGEITVWGDGEQTRSFCYIDDCIEATVALMESSYDEPVNIGSDRLVTINELADIIIGISGKQIEKMHDLSAPQGVRGRNADLERVKQVLGWEPRTPLETGLARTYDWIEQMVKRGAG